MQKKPLAKAVRSKWKLARVAGHTVKYIYKSKDKGLPGSVSCHGVSAHAGLAEQELAGDVVLLDQLPRGVLQDKRSGLLASSQDLVSQPDPCLAKLRDCFRFSFL